MSEREQAILYFKHNRKIFCEDHLKNCPVGSVAYNATMTEKKFYDLAIEALESSALSEDCVSRQAVDHLCFRYLKANTDDNIAFYEHFRDLPIIRPAQKTCKDCDQYSESEEDS